MNLGAIAIVCSALLATVAGCSSSGTDCSAGADNAVALIRAELELEAKTDADSKARQNKESMLPALKEVIVKSCKAEKWSESVRRCMATAKTTGGLEACDPDRDLMKKPDAPKDDSEDPPEPPATK